MMPMTRNLRPRNKRKPEQAFSYADDDEDEETGEPKAKETKPETHVNRNRGNACKTKITPTKAAMSSEKKQNAEEKKELGDGTAKGKEESKVVDVPMKPPTLVPSPLPPPSSGISVLKEKKKEAEGPPLSIEEEKLLATDVLALLKRFTPKYYVPLQKTWAIPKSQLTANQTQQK